MRIAVFYYGYLPGQEYGGPVTSLYNLTELLGDKIEFYIICTNHDLRNKNPYDSIRSGWNSVGKANVLYLPDEEFVKAKFESILDEIKPEIIYASSIFSVKLTYPLFALSKQKNIPLLLAPRGELNSDALANGRLKKYTYILGIKLLKKISSTFFQATSVKEKNDIIQHLGIQEDKVLFLPNVPILPKKKVKIDKQRGKLKLCFIGRIVENKNLLMAIKAVTLSSTNVKLDIYGSIEDEQYWMKCQSLINNSKESSRFEYKGLLPHSEIEDIYANYDCLISPTKFENYGQSIVEAMLHDVPVIISKGSTPWDDIAENKAGYVVPLEQIEGFANSIDELAEMSLEHYCDLINRLRQYCLSKFDYDYLVSQYMKAFLRITEE